MRVEFGLNICNFVKNDKMINGRMKTDREFYENLKEYWVLCYGGEGEPVFLVSRKWHGSAACVLFACLAYGFVIWFFLNYNFFKTE